MKRPVGIPTRDVGGRTGERVRVCVKWALGGEIPAASRTCASGMCLAEETQLILQGRTNMKSQQSGFTLVEIAIVLVIIGLLLGGILKGQELINSAKVKNLANDFRVIPTYIYAYQDRFKSLPGDDPQASTHVNGATTATTPAGKQGN